MSETKTATEKLALYGGSRAKTSQYGTGPKYGLEEEQAVVEALRQGTLFYALGKKTQQLCASFRERYGMEYAVATSSGTASIHVAMGCAGVGPGDEVILTPISDIGSVIGILYQNAVPVFADLEPYTFSPSADSIADRITDRTRAILVIHLAGNAADMDTINEVAAERGIAVIEDCAQAWGTRYKDKLVGSFGDMGCFSLNEFKHISAGDGGLVGTNNPEMGKDASLWADKCYDRSARHRNPWFLAPNYRMNELTAAVSLAQMARVDSVTSRRNELGRRLTAGISDLMGIHPLEERGECTFWFYMFRIDPAVLGVSRTEYVKALKAEGVACEDGYTADVMYKYTLFRERSAYPHSEYPFRDPESGDVVEYPDGLCPESEKIVDTCVWMPLNQWFTEKDIDEVAAGITKVTRHFLNEKGRR